MGKKNKRHKKLKTAQPKKLTRHPHICTGCGDKLLECQCGNSYIFAYRCRKCAGVPSETDKADLNIGIVRL